MHRAVLPVDEVGGFQQHHAAVAAPAEARLHVGQHHVKGLAVFAAQNVWVAGASCQGDRVALDNRVAIVERSEVVAVFAQCVAYLFFLRRVTCEVGEEVGYHLIFVGINLWSLGESGTCHGQRNH